MKHVKIKFHLTHVPKLGGHWLVSALNSIITSSVRWRSPMLCGQYECTKTIQDDWPGRCPSSPPCFQRVFCLLCQSQLFPSYEQLLSPHGLAVQPLSWGSSLNELEIPAIPLPRFAAKLPTPCPDSPGQVAGSWSFSSLQSPHGYHPTVPWVLPGWSSQCVCLNKRTWKYAEWAFVHFWYLNIPARVQEDNRRELGSLAHNYITRPQKTQRRSRVPTTLGKTDAGIWVTVHQGQMSSFNECKTASD